MAYVLNKEPSLYDKEKDRFIQELQHFHETRGTPSRRIPKINGHEIDLYLLYNLVTERGGWLKVNSRNEWEQVLADFDIPKRCVNSSVAIKQIYLRYLDRYEKIHFLGEVGERGADDDEDSRHRRWSARALHSVPLTYNHAQHNVNESLREYNGLSIDLHKPSEYEKLTLSLISPLPNEQDFAINICTLLSNEGKYCLKLDRHPRLLHFLLAHAAVFSNANIKSLFHELYGKDRGHSVAHIWRDVVADSNILRLADESLFHDKKFGNPSDIQLAQTSENKSNLKLDPEDNELFCLGRTLGIQDYIGQRVCQIATIVRNLTFLKENVPIMGRDLTFLRFVLLCCNSNWNGLQQMGWDMLGNICTEITIHSPLIEDILFISTRGLISQDRAIILSSLEVLNKLGQSETNEEYLLRYLEQEVYDRLCSFLTLHDIMLLVYTLECLNTISSLGEKACNSILRVRGALDILVSLITVEAQSYGPKACIQMRVVETVTGGGGGVVCQPTQSSTVSSTVTATNATPGAQQLLSSAASATPVLPHLAPTHQNLVTPISASGVTVAVPTPVPVSSTATLLTSPVSSSVTLSTVSTTQKIALAPASTPNSTIPAHATQQVAQENEQYALTWLRSTFELHTGGRIEQAELYKQYINNCQKIGRRGVIAPLHFPRCVRTVFGGSVGPKPSNVGDTTQHFYEGIQSRAKPLSPTPSVITTQVIQSPQVQSTPSPILKAQLSAPPKPTPSNPQSAKVTQRQQQQRLLQQQQSPPQLNSLIKIEEQSPSKSIPIQSVVFQNNKTVNCKVNGVRDPIDKMENPNGALFISGNEHSMNKPPPLTPLTKANNNSVNFLSDEAASASNSMASSTGNREGGEEGENSVSSFDGFMMNGVPNNLECEDATSKDSAPKSMMLADLLEKNVDKNEPPVLNGSLRIGEKGLELIQGKELIKKEIKEEKVRTINGLEVDPEKLDESSRDSLKRPSDSTDDFPESKKPHLNGDVKMEETPEEGAVSSTAANLYAALAADALEDEPLEELEPPQQQQQQQPLIMASPQPRQILVTGPGQLTQRVVVGGQHYVVTQPQTALVQGQTQTVLVAQTPQQQGTAAKTIIILQPQGVAGNQHQKVIMQRLQSPPPPLLATSQPQATPIRSVTPPKPSPTPPLIAPQPKTVKTIKTSVITPTIQTSNPVNQNASSVSSCATTQSISTVAMPSIPAPCATPVTVVTTSTLLSSSSSMATSNSITTSPSSTTPKTTEQGHFLCEWRGCMRNFKSGNEVYMHACEAHCPQGTQEIQCLWERCDAMKRKRFSLMTHLYDKHCNADVMRMMAVRRKQLSVSGRSEIPPPSPAAPHPGYAPNAAFHAIKRHALEFVNPKELQDDNEGPVTKSIRLTAALILRNLVIYSTHGRRHLTRYEPHLASVALSNVESSRTIAHVLFDMNNQR